MAANCGFRIVDCGLWIEYLVNQRQTVNASLNGSRCVLKPAENRSVGQQFVLRHSLIRISTFSDPVSDIQPAIPPREGKSKNLNTQIIKVKSAIVNRQSSIANRQSSIGTPALDHYRPAGP